MKTLFEKDLKVVNVGLQGFAANIAAAGGSVTHLSWSPPAGADAALGWTVANMIGDPRIDEANRAAYERYLAAQPRLVDFLLARDAIPVLAGAAYPVRGPADRLGGDVRPAEGCDLRCHSVRRLGDYD